MVYWRLENSKRRFPMKYLSEVKLQERVTDVDWSQKTAMAYVSTLPLHSLIGIIVTYWWFTCQWDNNQQNKMFACCAREDNHYCVCGDSLQLERKYETNNWSTRVSMTIFAMIVVCSLLEVLLKVNLQHQHQQRREGDKQRNIKVTNSMED
jgi:magnesium-transporting ATPase (P-type)